MFLLARYKHMTCILLSKQLYLGPHFVKAVENSTWLQNTHFVEPDRLHCSHLSFMCNLVTSDMGWGGGVILVNEIS